METLDKRARLMGEEKIDKLLIKLAIPAIIGMMVSAIYNIVDTIFVGRLGTTAIGAVTVAFPLFMLISSIGLTFGVGAASYISRLLGEGEKKQADKTVSTAFFTSFVSGIIFTIIGLIFLKPILNFFGATKTILPYAMDYSKILVLGSVFTMVNMTMNNMLRAEGSAKASMIALSVGAGLNIVLDPIMMFWLDMGIEGASAATVISQIVSTIWLLYYYLKGKSYTRISLKHFTFSSHIYCEILKIGVPTFIRQFLISISMAFVNSAAAYYGDSAVASLGITNRVLAIGMYVLLGYTQGFQPVAGFNYGAKKFNRLKEAIKISLKWTSIFTTCFWALIMIFAKFIIRGFSDDSEVIKIGTYTLRSIALFFPLFGFQTVYMSLYQALGKGLIAGILSLARQGLFFIPSVLILPNIFGLNGVIFSQPTADFLTLILTATFAFKVTKEINNLERA